MSGAQLQGILRFTRVGDGVHKFEIRAFARRSAERLAENFLIVTFGREAEKLTPHGVANDARSQVAAAEAKIKACSEERRD